MNVFELLAPSLDQVSILSVELLDMNFSYGVQRVDQSLSPIVESAIEIILRRNDDTDLEHRGRYNRG